MAEKMVVKPTMELLNPLRHRVDTRDTELEQRDSSCADQLAEAKRETATMRPTETAAQDVGKVEGVEPRLCTRVGAPIIRDGDAVATALQGADLNENTSTPLVRICERGTAHHEKLNTATFVGFSGLVEESLPSFPMERSAGLRSGGRMGESFFHDSRRSTILGNNLMGSRNTACSHCKMAESVLYACPCGLASYCSTSCQRSHWTVHKKMCRNGVKGTFAPCRRCDWCGTVSDTMRQCQCSRAFYCNLHCQLEDRPIHRCMCRQLPSQSPIAAAPSALSLTAAAAAAAGCQPRCHVSTQTAHWEISVPSLRPSTGAERPISLSPLPQPGSFSAGSEGPSVEGKATTGTPPPGQRRSRLSMSMSGYSGGPATAAAGAAPAAVEQPTRLGASFLHRVDGAAHFDPPMRSGHKYPSASGSYVLHFPGRAVLAGGARRDGGLSFSIHSRAPSMLGEPPGATLVTPGRSAASIVATSSSAPKAPMESVSFCHEGYEMDLPNSATTPVVSMASFPRDHPTLVVFLMAARQLIETEETKERQAMLQRFHLRRLTMELTQLRDAEEEQRMVLLREEVMWLVSTGFPAWKKLKDAIFRFYYS